MTLFDRGVLDGLTRYLTAAQTCRGVVEPLGRAGMLAGGTSRSEWAAGWLRGIALGAGLRVALYSAYGGPLA
jgi:hypothetical protein